MDIKELQLGVNPFIHWYYQSKKIPLLSFIKESRAGYNSFSTIDIGAGSGFFSEVLIDAFPERIKTSYLIDTAYSQTELNEKLQNNVLRQHYLPDNISHSVVLMMDVLEHLEDDLGMLINIKDKSDGLGNNSFFITVPAFQTIWSGHDIYLEHYRRYTKKTLLALLDKAELKTDRIYYLYGSLFPLVLLKRKLGNLFSKKESLPVSDMKPLPEWLNTILLKYCTIEMGFTKLNRIFGLTCVAEGKF